MKTRLQLQGRYNNPFFNSGYNYRSTTDAFRTILRGEGFGALFSGYKATIFRDLPFSALQFAFYEQEQKYAKEWVGSKDIGLGLEILTATTAGGMAGVLTCPMDVVKTRAQTQQNPEAATPQATPESTTHSRGALRGQPIPSTVPSAHQHPRSISTSSPSAAPAKPQPQLLNTSSVFLGLKEIYHAEGIIGWFRGVGPRGVWTSIQSGTMLVLYQFLLRQMESWQGADELNSSVL